MWNIILYTIDYLYVKIEFLSLHFLSLLQIFQKINHTARPRRPDDHFTPKPEVPASCSEDNEDLLSMVWSMADTAVGKDCHYQTTLWRTDAVLINFES